MASFPFINTFSPMGIFSLIRLLRFLLVDLDGQVGAHQRAEGAPGAFLRLEALDWMITHAVETLCEPQDLLRASVDAVAAALAPLGIDDDLRHS
jgi:hypothetical protein